MIVRLGLLVCDHIPDGLATALGGTYTDAFPHLFDTCDAQVTIASYSVVDDEFPQHIDEADGWIITGSRFFATDETTVGFQGHPEFTSEFTDAIITMREAEIGSEAATKARASLDDPTHAATVAWWITNLVAG